MKEIFIKSESVRTTRTTRSSNDTNLYIPFRKNEYGKNCLSYLGATVWNSIHGTIRDVKTCKIKEKYFKDIEERENGIYNTDAYIVA